MTYAEKLKDPRWQRKRLQILERDKWKCCLCGDEETTFHVHHKKYNGNPWEAADEDLITYCEHCHCIVSSYTQYFIHKITKEKNKHNDCYFIGLAEDMKFGPVLITLEFIESNNNYKLLDVFSYRQFDILMQYISIAKDMVESKSPVETGQ